MPKMTPMEQLARRMDMLDNGDGSGWREQLLEFVDAVLEEAAKAVERDDVTTTAAVRVRALKQPPAPPAEQTESGEWVQ